MIYEFRTYTIHPRSLPEFLKTFGEALPGREAYSKLTAFWFTEIGPLNQVIHVWGYDSVNERNRIRAEAAKAGIWPPKTSHLIVDMKSEIMIPASCSPDFAAADVGPYFEMRTYILKPGSCAEDVGALGRIPARSSGAVAAGWRVYIRNRRPQSMGAHLGLQ